MTTVPMLVRIALAQLKRASQLPVAVRLVRRYVGNDQLDHAGAIAEVNDAAATFTYDTFLATQVTELMSTFADHLDNADIAYRQLQSQLTLRERQIELFYRRTGEQNERLAEVTHIRDLAQQRCHDLEGVLADQAIEIQRLTLKLKDQGLPVSQANLNWRAEPDAYDCNEAQEEYLADLPF